jgi:hypothetical protein
LTAAASNPADSRPNKPNEQQSLRINRDIPSSTDSAYVGGGEVRAVENWAALLLGGAEVYRH